MINVTKAYLPDIEKYKSYVDKIYDSGWLTNNGSLVRELERRLKEYLGVKHVVLVANGSLALQIAYKALDLRGEVITTPFSFAATTSTLAWEGLCPRFADIDKKTFNVDPLNIEKLINSNTSAILPVHVFGNPCDVYAIDSIAKKNNLRVIYDAAHAFNSRFEGESVLIHGDISTLSFHATKLFHTIEGGAVITNDDDLERKIRLLINFGITGPLSIESVGTNAKMNEFEAAMGLCNLDEISEINKTREDIWKYYADRLHKNVIFQQWNPLGKNNFSYAPIVFESEKVLLSAESNLKDGGVIPRRYFYPSLDSLPYIEAIDYCENSRDIANRIMCLPIYPGLEERDLDKIIEAVKNT